MSEITCNLNGLKPPRSEEMYKKTTPKNHYNFIGTRCNFVKTTNLDQKDIINQYLFR